MNLSALFSYFQTLRIQSFSLALGICFLVVLELIGHFAIRNTEGGISIALPHIRASRLLQYVPQWDKLLYSIVMAVSHKQCMSDLACDDKLKVATSIRMSLSRPSFSEIEKASTIL